MIGKSVLVFLFCLGGTVMADTVGQEAYYSRFYTNYRHPFGVEEKYRITKEEAEKLKAYVIVRRDAQGRIISMRKILYNECFFHNVYEYDKDGKLISFKNLCRPEEK